MSFRVIILEFVMLKLKTMSFRNIPVSRPFFQCEINNSKTPCYAHNNRCYGLVQLWVTNRFILTFTALLFFSEHLNTISSLLTYTARHRHIITAFSLLFCYALCILSEHRRFVFAMRCVSILNSDPYPRARTVAPNWKHSNNFELFGLILGSVQWRASHECQNLIWWINPKCLQLIDPHGGQYSRCDYHFAQ